MKLRSVPAGIAALVVALAVGFAWKICETSGEPPANADMQPRLRAAAASAFPRGDRLDAARALRRGDRLDAAQRALQKRVVTARFAGAFAVKQPGAAQHAVRKRVFTARFADAFGAKQPDARDAVANAVNDETANDAALAYAAPQAPAPKRSIVPPEKQTRLASLESVEPAPASPAPAMPAIPDDGDWRTAIYDISAHTVYLPGGEKLEAHSGLGNHIDDPHSASLRNRGATPPNIYRLALREHLFHGVRALRLIPVGDGNMYGRDGILAHTYMLGPTGQSNGCLAVRNYAAFLQAFLEGKVERLVVVGRRSSDPRVASLR